MMNGPDHLLQRRRPGCHCLQLRDGGNHFLALRCSAGASICSAAFLRWPLTFYLLPLVVLCGLKH